MVTERAERSSVRAESAGVRRIAWTPLSVVLVWLLFGLLALQETGIAPFMQYISLGDFPQTKGVALLAMWTATIAAGAAAVVHTLVVTGGDSSARRELAVSVRRRTVPWAMMIGALIGITAAAAMCVNDWSNPWYCIALPERLQG